MTTTTQTELTDVEATQLRWEATRSFAAQTARDWALDDALVFFVEAKPRAAFFAPRKRERYAEGRRVR